MKNVVGKRLRARLTKKRGWHIAIDDGFCAYLYALNASGSYSIGSLFRKIQKSIKRGRKVKTEATNGI
ncbi:MAG: hypothetical protein IMZ64_14805 [Bacteroidetes bacterium]|nr:hypothetical protein [Bacteroidota bacterium]